MLSNRDIKRREIYKAQQKLIRVLGDFKKAQQEYLYATNQLALDELKKPNALVTAVHKQKFKSAVKQYINLYGEKIGLEEHIAQLKQWKVED